MSYADDFVRIDLINLSERTDDELRPIIQAAVDDLEINRDIRFIFQRVWSEIDDNGQPIPETEKDIAFDADATDTNIVRVCISKNMVYPFVWDVNPKLEGEYLRNVTFFLNEEEFFVYLVSHELRHLFQWQNEFRASLIYQVMESDAELDSDFYATKALSRYRADNQQSKELMASLCPHNQLWRFTFNVEFLGRRKFIVTTHFNDLIAGMDYLRNIRKRDNRHSYSLVETDLVDKNSVKAEHIYPKSKIFKIK